MKILDKRNQTQMVTVIFQSSVFFPLSDTIASIVTISMKLIKNSIDIIVSRKEAIIGQQPLWGYF